MEKIIISVIVLLLFQGCTSHSSINKNHTLKNTSAKMLVYNKPQKIKTEKKRKKRVSCKNFSTQAHAQKYFDAKKHGWKGLDRDKDGEPCECLSGGSNEHESVCKYWRKKNHKR